MRIALFSDVHGNLAALEAVLAAIDAQGVDLVIFAGDLCLFGPRPAACIDLVRQRGIVSVHGNTDLFILGAGSPPERVAPHVDWTRAQLSDDHLEWLRRLPFGFRVSPTGRAGDDLAVVHANPLDVNGIIFPPEAYQQARYGQVRQSDADLQPLLGDLTAAVLAYGHLHIPSARPWGNGVLLNVSSVSMPGDGDPAAKYALLTWDGQRWAWRHERVAYRAADETAAFRALRPPRWEQAVAELETQGLYFPQNV